MIKKKEKMDSKEKIFPLENKKKVITTCNYKKLKKSEICTEPKNPYSNICKCGYKFKPDQNRYTHYLGIYHQIHSKCYIY